MKKICSIVLLLGLTLGAILIIRAYLQHTAQQDAIDPLRQVYAQARPTVSQTDPETAVLEQTQQTGQTQQPDLLADAKQVNPATVAWLTIPDTAIDFPVLQGEDNSYYLNHDFQGASSSYGVPFLDYRCEADFGGYNSIVYGHNIRGGQMFGGLVEFQRADTFQAHPTGTLITDQKCYEIRFLYCCVVESHSDLYQAVFLTPEERKHFWETAKASAVQSRSPGDVVLTEQNCIVLSTCSYEFEEARTVLVGYLEEV